eukprot:CAMPEP_0177569064 /NCGR_PEP_ID=MMETSP0369-20130122/76098_1 /TAXON_ID=447022 ORGANISM="Scrippsiella hangoei-like, Strain SHHI-4" /NCGR_SAMPLE_ID=MMETSP0369 /ASSEMBLY_ACC=CAM_ASM_000364 /LENGTH=159 /DNA_ID=CAMNT_0019056691 /DNA_START=85 /DNA_END=559 /DNA_ORIENTATION=+
MYGSQNSSRAAACEDAISLYSFGVFEISMLVANFEATSFLVFGTLAFVMGLGASMLGAWLLPIFVYVERRRRQQEKKLCDAAVSALEQFCYTAGAGGEALLHLLGVVCGGGLMQATPLQQRAHLPQRLPELLAEQVEAVPIVPQELCADGAAAAAATAA